MGGLLLPVEAGNSGQHDRKAVHDHPGNFQYFFLLVSRMELFQWDCIPFNVLSRSGLKLAMAERMRDVTERAIDRKTVERFQNIAVAYQGPWT